MEKQFDVTGMTCAACQANVTRAVSKLEGVEDVDVSLLSNSMKVTFDDSKVDSQMICQVVSKIGYGASEKGAKQERSSFQKEWNDRQSKAQKEQRSSFVRLMTSVGLLIPLMLIAMGPMMGLPILSGEQNAMISALSQVLLATLILFIQRHFFIHGFQSLIHRAPNMDSLVAIGSGASYLYGLYAVYQMAYGFGYGHMEMVHHSMHAMYFESAAMIVTLVSVGKYLESRSKKKTGDALDKLVDLTPKMASVIRGGVEILIPAEELVKGDRIVIRPGDRIPADGTVVSGNGVVDQSAITGESIPVDKEAGDVVLSATLNQNGSFVFEASKVGEESTLAQIIQLVDEAGNSKAPIARIADKVAGIFVPVVIGIAALTGVIWILLGQSIEFSLSNAVAVLVISCPCALGLATPVAIMVSTGKAAEYGILVKSAASLENLAHMDTIVLDKTGTITSGKPSVQKVLSLEEEKEAFEKMKQGDMKARDKLISHNLRLVAHIVKKYTYSLEADDLLSVGTIGLIKAIDTFDYGKKVQLSTYAARCINNEILMLIRSNKKHKNVVSLNSLTSNNEDDKDLELKDVLASDDEEIFSQVENNLIMQKIKTIIANKLDKREQAVIKLRYGIDCEKALTQKEVAQELGISRSYISRIENKTLKVIKEEFEKDEQAAQKNEEKSEKNKTF